MIRIVVFLGILLIFLMLGLSKIVEKAESSHMYGVFVKNQLDIQVRAVITKDEHPDRSDFNSYGIIIPPGNIEFVEAASIHIPVNKALMGLKFNALHIHDLSYNHIISKNDVRNQSTLVLYYRDGAYHLDYEQNYKQ